MSSKIGGRLKLELNSRITWGKKPKYYPEGYLIFKIPLLAFFLLMVSPPNGIAAPAVGEQLKSLGYAPATCLSTPPSTYKTGDTSVPLTVFNDLPVRLQPTYLDLQGVVKLLAKREANSSWQDSTYKGTIWLWLDDSNKTCLGMSQIQDLRYQSKVIRISELSSHQIAAVASVAATVESAASKDITTRALNDVQTKERAALAALYGVTDGGGWRNKTGWLTDEPHCEWYGISCDNGRVTKISLHSNGLTGQIPAVIGELRGLKTLQLARNKLSGGIPPEISNLRQLNNLHLSDNQLSGRLPTSFSRLTKMRSLTLQNNFLEGRLNTVGFMRLYNLNVSGNKFLDTLSSLGKQTGMRYFYIADNNFYGNLPSWIQDWKYLYNFDISNNQLSGNFPREVAERLAQSRSAKISGNNFKCPVPFVLRDTLANGKEFCVGFDIENTYDGVLEGYYDYLAVNDSGGLAFQAKFKNGLRDGLHRRWHPDGSLMHEAEYADGMKNGARKSWDEQGRQWEFKNYLDDKLHGTYATFNKGAVNKQYCYKRGKKIADSSCEPDFDKDEKLSAKSERNALVELYQATGGSKWKKKAGWLSEESHCNWYGITCMDGTVTKLELKNNNLEKTLPPSINKLRNLQTLSLPENNFSGPFPSVIRELDNLKTLNLRDNNFSGNLPAWLGDLRQLSWCSISQNKFEGELPSSIANLTKLRSFSAEHNQLQGSLPAWSNNVYSLYLGYNQFSGAINTQLAYSLSDSHRYQYNFSNNHFSCPFPEGVVDIFAQRGEFCIDGQVTKIFSGPMKGNHENGKPAFSGSFVEGKRDGAYKRWFRNGNVREESFFASGKLQGLGRFFYESGSIRTLTNYLSDRRHGKQISYATDGSIQKVKCFGNGKSIPMKDCEEQSTTAGKSQQDAKKSRTTQQPSNQGASGKNTSDALTGTPTVPIEKKPITAVNSSGKKSELSIGEKLSLLVHDLNSQRRTYNQAYALENVKMDFDADHLVYKFTLGDEGLYITEETLQASARAAYCNSSKMIMFRQEGIGSVWEYRYEGKLRHRILIQPQQCLAM
ncbi:hypothetical protein N9N82_11945 [Luminiphilus sp.]|nr:hypothetical protein [Luminiphilus sp.]